MKKNIVVVSLFLFFQSFAQQTKNLSSDWILNPPKDDFSIVAVARESSKLEAFVSAFGILVSEMDQRTNSLQKKKDKKSVDLLRNISSVRKSASHYSFGEISVGSENKKTVVSSSSKNGSVTIEYSFPKKSETSDTETLSIIRNGLSEKNLYQAIKNSGVEMTHVVSTEREEEKHYVLLVFRP